MAAVDPPKSPKRQTTPEEEVETSVERAEAVGSGCDSPQKGEAAGDKAARSPDGERGADVGSDGGCVASHSEVSVESGAGADTTTRASPEDLTAAEKMAEAPGGEERAYDWSEAEDDDEPTKTSAVEKDQCGMLMYFTLSFSLLANLGCSPAKTLSSANVHLKAKPS